MRCVVKKIDSGVAGLSLDTSLAVDQLEALSARVDDTRPGVASHPLGSLDSGAVLSLANAGTSTARGDVGERVETFVATGTRVVDGAGGEVLGAELLVHSKTGLLIESELSGRKLGSSDVGSSGGDTAGSLTLVESGVPGVSLGATLAGTHLLLLGLAADLVSAGGSGGAAETGRVQVRGRPGEASGTLGNTLVLAGIPVLGGSASGLADLVDGVIDHGGVGANALSVDQRLVARATLGVSHPSLTDRAFRGADAVGESLGRVGADTLSGGRRVLLLTSRAADGLVTGPTASAAHFVAQDLSIGAGSGTVTLSVGGTGAGKSAADSAETLGSTRTTVTIGLQTKTFSTLEGLVATGTVRLGSVRADVTTPVVASGLGTSGVLVVLSVQGGELLPDPLVDEVTETVSVTEGVDVSVTDAAKVVVDRDPTSSEGTGDLVTPEVGPGGLVVVGSLGHVGVSDGEIKLDVGDLELRNVG